MPKIVTPTTPKPFIVYKDSVGAQGPTSHPWRVVTDGINYWVEVNNRIIIVSKGRSKVEAKQHANLIAAAPEMLEALVNLMDCYRDCFGLPDIDRTEDIISKAKGQTYQDHQDKQGEV